MFAIVLFGLDVVTVGYYRFGADLCWKKYNCVHSVHIGHNGSVVLRVDRTILFKKTIMQLQDSVRQSRPQSCTL